jgi:hypothetical protein
MEKKTQHVVIGPTGRWSVRPAGAARATKSFPSKEAAVRYAKRIARDERTGLFVHKRDGGIQESVNYGASMEWSKKG